MPEESSLLRSVIKLASPRLWQVSPKVKQEPKNSMFERLWNRLSFSLPRQSGNGVLPGEVKTAETNLAFPATCQQAAGALEGGELPFHAPNPTRHDTGLINTASTADASAWWKNVSWNSNGHLCKCLAEMIASRIDPVSPLFDDEKQIKDGIQSLTGWRITTTTTKMKCQITQENIWPDWKALVPSLPEFYSLSADWVIGFSNKKSGFKGCWNWQALRQD